MAQRVQPGQGTNGVKILATTTHTKAWGTPAHPAARPAGAKGNRKESGARRKASRGKPRAAKPITAHPLFPAIVALWFGALFGLGSLAIRPGLLESVVLALHIDTIIPATAPPLGITARILLALTMGAFGAVLGLMMARRLTRPKVEAAAPRRRGTAPAAESAAHSFAQRSRDAHPDAPARRPISAHEELGEDDLADDMETAESGIAARIGAQPIPGRRRALAISDDAPRDYHDLAPLPGGAPQILDIGAFVIDDTQPAGDEVHGALDLGAFAPPRAPAPFAAPASELQSFATPISCTAPFAPEVPAHEGMALVRLGPANPDGTAVAYDASAEVAEAAPGADLPRVPHGAEVPPVNAARAGSIFDLPVAATRLFERPADDDQPLANLVIAPVEATQDDADQADTPAPTVTAPIAAAPTVGFSLPQGPAAARISGASLVALSQVELIERLALSLQRRRDLDDVAPAGATDAAPAGETLVLPAFRSDPAPQAAVASEPGPVPAFSPPAAEPVWSEAPVTVPSALRPLNFDDTASLDELPNLLMPRHLAMPTPAPAPWPQPESAESDVEAEEITADGDGDDEGYSSLLDLKLVPAPPRQTFVRIEESQPLGGEIEPVVIFPGQGGFHKPAAAAPITVAPIAGDEESPVLRRFDAPGSPGLPSQATADAGSPIKDPVETERALRAALASLQRMSGAA